MTQLLLAPGFGISQCPALRKDTLLVAHPPKKTQEIIAIPDESPVVFPAFKGFVFTAANLNQRQLVLLLHDGNSFERLGFGGHSRV